MKDGEMYIVDGGHFVAALIVNDKGLVIDSAPILKYYVGGTLYGFKRYCEKRKWKITPLYGPESDKQSIQNVE